MSPPRLFGFLPTGESVDAFTLTNSAHASVTILTLGGIVTSLRMPDRNGVFANLVLGFDVLTTYVAGHPYFGAIAGRVAGRITEARFTLDDIIHPLAANDGSNHLHGGLRGFDKHVWSAHPVTRPDGADSLRLTRLSPDGEEGYPGNVTVAVTYTLTADHALIIDSEASTDQATPFSLTHHGYFNLAGEGSGSVANHTLQIHADAYAPTDAAMTILGRRESVTAANDFRQPRLLAEAIPHLHQHHGDLYFLSAATGLREVARLTEPTSSRILTVTTTEACLQLYTGVSLDDSLIGKSGCPYGPHDGLCLECEGYPDGANTPALGDIILRPGTLQRHTTTYAFTTA